MERSSLANLKNNILQRSKKAIQPIREFIQWDKARLLHTRIILAVLGLLLLLGNIPAEKNDENLNSVIDFLVLFANRVRGEKYGGLILLVLIVIAAFPPMFGVYGYCVITGLLYGMTLKSWLIVTSGTVIGSIISFLSWRCLLSRRAEKWRESSRLFSAFSTVLAEDKHKFLLLCLLQLFPRPYSIANAMFATIPKLDVYSFLFSVILTSPRYLMMVYAGSQIENLKEHMSEPPSIVDLIIIFASYAIPLTTAYLVYKKIKRVLAKENSTVEDDEVGVSLMRYEDRGECGETKV